MLRAVGAATPSCALCAAHAPRHGTPSPALSRCAAPVLCASQSGAASRSKRPAALALVAALALTLNGAPEEQRIAAAQRSTLHRPALVGAASAAIPSISEYDAVQYKKKAPPPPSAPEVDLASLGPRETLKLAQSGLARASALVDAGNLEAVRALLREPIFAKGLGFSPGVRGNAGNLKPNAALVSAGVDRPTLEELILSLKRLDDFCLENRVIVFNVEDLEAVKGLMASSGRDGSASGKLDVGEARELLADARELLDVASRSVK